MYKRQGSIDFSFRADPEAEMKKLAGLPGIGICTAQYIAMRVFGWTDAFPSTEDVYKRQRMSRMSWCVLEGMAVK